MEIYHMENQNNLHTKNGVSKASAQNRWWNHGISRFLDYSDFEDDSSSDDRVVMMKIVSIY